MCIPGLYHDQFKETVYIMVLLFFCLFVFCSFNPVAHTSLIKTLHRIASTECQVGSSKSGCGLLSSRTRSSEQLKFFMPPREVLEGLAESCNGDIRSAINSLQFVCLTGIRSRFGHY